MSECGNTHDDKCQLPNFHYIFSHVSDNNYLQYCSKCFDFMYICIRVACFQTLQFSITMCVCDSYLTEWSPQYYVKVCNKAHMSFQMPYMFSIEALDFCTIDFLQSIMLTSFSLAWASVTNINKKLIRDMDINHNHYLAWDATTHPFILALTSPAVSLNWRWS